MGAPNHAIDHLAPRYEVATAFSDHEKAERVFSRRAQTPLRDGLARMAAWARVEGVQSGKPFQGIEINRHLPEVWRRVVRDARQTF